MDDALSSVQGGGGVRLGVSPQGHFFVEAGEGGAVGGVGERIRRAFGESVGAGLLQLATGELQAHLSADLDFARELGRQYLTRLCRSAGEAEKG